MKITLLNANEFTAIKGGKEVYFSAGYGYGRNSNYIKVGEDGKIYAKLSPIALPEYSGTVKEVSGRTARQILNTLRYNKEI